MKNQHLSLDELEYINWSKRQKLLTNAYEHSPFYRAKYLDAGLHPYDIRRPEDFEKIPCLTRQELRTSCDQILIPDAKSRFLTTSSTGGSTGVPVEFFVDKRVPAEVVSWRMMSWWGIEPYMDGAFVWRLRRRSGFQQFLNSVAWWPTVKIRLDVSLMSEASIQDFISKFNALKPPLLQGYTGAINHLAMEVTQKRLRVHSPRAIWVTSSPITGVQRELIANAFQAPVYDQYGSCEVSSLSAECGKSDGLHINHDTVHIEFVDQNGHSMPVGETGDIVVTDLQGSAFPIIRYINGDRGRALPGKCPCGITLPLMGQVQGRVSDMIRLPSGRVISGDYLTTLFDAFPEAVRQFQVRQRWDCSITVLYVPNFEYSELSTVLKNIKATLEANVHNEVTVSVEEVDAIPHDRGKLRFVVSEIA